MQAYEQITLAGGKKSVTGSIRLSAPLVPSQFTPTLPHAPPTPSAHNTDGERTVNDLMHSTVCFVFDSESLSCVRCDAPQLEVLDRIV
jgi:hypothetical protein